MKATLHPMRVLVVVNNAEGYARGVVRGVTSFAFSRAWECHLQGVNTPEALESPGPIAGIVAQISTPDILRRLREHAIPVVNVSSALALHDIPSVVCDDQAVGRLGAEHFLRQGYRNLLFFDPVHHQFAKLRQQGFCARVAASSCAADIASDVAELARALFELPKPLAVMACNDASALAVLRQCRMDHHQVPDEVAVLGVDNDDLMQSLALPPLSSIRTATERIGFEAAAVLDGLIRHPRQKPVHRLVAPAGIVTRLSSDRLAIADRDVLEAVHFIRQHAAANIGVPDIVRGVSTSRRQLERKFRELLGRSVLDEIRRCRIDLARQLLLDTELTLDQVAIASGFQSTSYFNVVFRRAMGNAPGAFRTQQRSNRLVAGADAFAFSPDVQFENP